MVASAKGGPLGKLRERVVAIKQHAGCGKRLSARPACNVGGRNMAVLVFFQTGASDSRGSHPWNFAMAGVDSRAPFSAATGELWT